MGVWDDIREEEGLTPKTTAAPTPSAATSSAAGGVGGGQLVETLKAEPGPGMFSGGGIPAWDYSKALEDKTNELFAQRHKEGIEDDGVGYTYLEKAREEAAKTVDATREQMLAEGIPVVDFDPRGVGATVRHQVEYDPGVFARESVVGKHLPESVQDWTGRNIAGPIAAFSRGIEESLYMPSERNEDGSPRLHEQGPMPYNELTDSPGVEQASRFAASTFGSTAAAAGQEAAQPGEWAYKDPTSWTIPQLVAATYEGWGSPEQLRKLERGHDVITLRNELELGRLIPNIVAESWAMPLEAIGQDELAGAMRETIKYPQDMTAALAISIVDVDAFMGLGAGARAVREAKLAVGASAEVGTLKQAADFLELPALPWGAKAKVRGMTEAATRARAELQALREATSLAGDSARFDANKAYQEWASRLPRGMREVVHALTQTMTATDANSSSIALKKVRAAQEAEAAMARLGGDFEAELVDAQKRADAGLPGSAKDRPVPEETPESAATSAFVEGDRSPRKTPKWAGGPMPPSHVNKSEKTRAAYRAGLDASRMEAINAGNAAKDEAYKLATHLHEGDAKAAEDLLGIKSPTAAQQKATSKGHAKASRQGVSIKKKALEYTVARTRHAAAEAAVADLRTHKRSLQLLAQAPGAIGGPHRIEATRETVEKAFNEMVAARDAMGKTVDPNVTLTPEQVDPQELYRALSQKYQDTTLEAVRNLGRNAGGLLDEQLKTAEEQLKTLQGEYGKSRKALERLLPKDKDAHHELRKVIASHDRTVKQLSKAERLADTHHVLLAAADKAMEHVEAGFKALGSKMPATPEEEAIAQQSLLTAEAMRYIGAGKTKKAALTVAGIVQELFLPSVAATRRFGGATELVAKSGKMADNAINIGLADFKKIGADQKDRAVLGIIDYFDTADSVSGSQFNALGDLPLFREAVPILRAMAAQKGAQGKELEALAYMFMEGENVTTAKKSRLRDALTNLVNYGQATKPKEFKGKAPKTAKGRATRAAKQAEYHEVAQNLTYDRLLQRLYAASVDILDDPQLASWIRYKQELVEGTEEYERVARMSFKEIIAEGHAAQRARALGQEMTPGMRAAAATVGGLERSVVRGSQAVLQAAITSKVGRMITTETGATPEALKALFAISEGDYHKAGQGMLEAATVMEKLGMDLTSRTMRAAGDDVRTGVQVLSDPQGKFYGFIPRPFIHNMDQKLGRIVNSDEAFTSPSVSPSADAVSQWARSMIRATQTSMLTGLVFPNPRYYTNITVGNFTQMWSTSGVGLGTAAKVSLDTASYMAQGVGTRIEGLPGVSKVLEGARERMATKLGVDVDRVLPTLTSAIMSPHVAAVFDTKIAKAGDVVPDAFKRGHTWGQLRNDLWEQGVLSSFVQASTLQRLGERTRSWDAMQRSGMWEKLSGARDKWADMADGLEQRQRISLYMELVYNKGMSPEEAGKAVRDSLYDWAAPMTSLEADWAVQLFMFWNFQRRAMGQALRIMGSPITETEGKPLKEFGAWALPDAEDLASTGDSIEYVDPRKLADEMLRRAGDPKDPSVPSMSGSWEMANRETKLRGIEDHVRGKGELWVPQLNDSAELGFGIGDGRHRILWAAEQGLEKIPVRVGAESKGRFGRFKPRRGGMSVGEAAVASNTVFSAMAGKKATSMAHFRDLVKTYHAAKEGARSGGQDSDVYPWWARLSGQHAMVTNVPMSPQRMEFDQARGVANTTLAYTFPNATPSEYMNLFARMGQLTSGYAKEAVQSGPLSEEARAVAGEGAELGLREVAKFGGFVTEDMITGVLDAMYGPDHPDFGAGYKLVKNPAEVVQFRALDAAMVGEGMARGEDVRGQGFVHYGPDGGVYVARELLAFKAMMPLVGIELNRAMEPFIYGAAEVGAFGDEMSDDPEDYMRSIAMMFGNFTGAGRSIGYSPEKVHEQDLKYGALEQARRDREEAKFSDTKPRDFWGRIREEEGITEPTVDWKDYTP